MRRFRLLILFLGVFNLISSHAQNVQRYENDSITNLQIYRDSSVYQKDLLLFLDMLKDTHPAFAVGLTPPFNIDSIKEAGYEWGKRCVSIPEFKNYLQSVLCRLNDGHTTLLPNYDMSSIYPFIIFKDNEKVYLRGINKEYGAFLGKEIIEINSYPVLKVIDSFKTSVSSDNDIYFYDKVDKLMQLYSTWKDHVYGLPDSTLQFKFSNGEIMNLRPVSKQEINLAVLPDKAPSNSVRKNTKLPFLYEILPEKGICYLQFNACMDQSSLRLQYEMSKSGNNLSKEVVEQKLSQVPRFDEFLDLMFKDVREKEVKTLVIDVRNNSGGNSKLCDVLLSWLKPYGDITMFSSSVRFSKLWEQNYPLLANQYRQAFQENKQLFEIGKLYSSISLPPMKENSDIENKIEYFRLNKDVDKVFKGNIIFIQNERTYSSAGLLISTVMDNALGIVIGTKSSYRPCNYGDVLSWELPNTGIKGFVSYKVFKRPDITKCAELTLIPDVDLKSSWQSVLDNNDICWEWIQAHY